MWPIVNMLEEDRATDSGNMHKNLVKIAHVVPEISSRTGRQTDRQTHRQTYSSQYFTAAPVSEVKNTVNSKHSTIFLHIHNIELILFITLADY